MFSCLFFAFLLVLRALNIEHVFFDFPYNAFSKITCLQQRRQKCCYIMHIAYTYTVSGIWPFIKRSRSSHHQKDKLILSNSLQILSLMRSFIPLGSWYMHIFGFSYYNIVGVVSTHIFDNKWLGKPNKKKIFIHP
jgi:hypothetical protein